MGDRVKKPERAEAMVIESAREHRMRHRAMRSGAIGLALMALVAASAAGSGGCKRTGPGGYGRMVRVPAGSFEMGRRDASEYEAPAHRVSVAAFEIDATEVPVAAYRACVEASACEALTEALGGHCNWTQGSARAGRDTHPINCVTPHQAEAFCHWAGKRLPTEEEWEYAARGSDGRLLPWGDTQPASPPCWERPALRGGALIEQDTCAIGASSTDVSPFGVMDMAGNVREWTASGCPTGNRVCEADHSLERIVRGASWQDRAGSESWIATRRDYSPATPSGAVGFRCVK